MAIAAAAGTLLVAGGVAFAANRLLQPGSSQLQLPGVSASALLQAGIRLAPASPPPWCGVVDAARGHGLSSEQTVDCPITRSDATGLVTTGQGATVTAAALARASSATNPAIGQGRLVWALVVTRNRWVLPPLGAGRPVIACPVRPPVTPVAMQGPPFCGSGPFTTLTLLDAYSGQTLMAAGLSGGLVSAGVGKGAAGWPVTATPAVTTRVVQP